MSNKPLLLALFFSCALTANGQTFVMNGAPIASCSGTFLDGGGSAGNYPDNQNLHTTICPDGMGGSHILLHFDSLLLLSGDSLCILDGSNVLAPALICFNNSLPSQPFQVQASANNPGGCLTVTFVSDANGTAAGWSAQISCGNPCEVPAPGNAQVVAMNGGSMTWVWDPVPGSAGFEVSVNGGPWLPASGALSHTVNGLVPGNLVVIEIRPISANPGCTVQSVTVNMTFVECLLAASVATLDSATCFGTTTGSALIVANGMIGPTQFFIVGNPAPFPSGDFSVFFAAGNYQVAVSDTAGCRDTIAFSILEPPPITIQTTATDAECFADNSGAVSAMATGGTGTLTYSWRRCQGGAIMTGPVVIDLFAGCYAVTVTDINGCTAVAQDTIGEPPKFEFTSAQDSVTCFGGMDGGASVFAIGAIPPYTYKWNNNDTTFSADSLKAGFHSVTVTDAIGCQAVTLVQVLQPTLMVVDSISSAPIACFGGSNGMATVFAHGGILPYSYVWSNSQTTQTATGLGAGVHTVTLTDRNGCTATRSVSLVAPAELVVQISNAQDETCTGACDGQLVLAISGGTGARTISWSHTGIPPDEPAPQNLCAGTYTATVTDANGCSTTVQAVISAATPLAVLFSGNPPLCAGDQNGSLTAMPTGGALPHQFMWSTGETTGSIQNLVCGAYSVTISDANGCTLVSADTLPCPDPVLIDSIVPQAVLCSGGTNGSVTVFAQGGTGMLAFAWSLPNAPSSPGITNIGMGIYSVTVSDANGCSASASATVSQPPVLSVVVLATAVSCFGGNNGTAKSTTTGGAQPYQYAWNPPASTPDLGGLTAGTYSLTVTDFNGCTAVAQSAVVTQPAGPLQVAAVQTRRSCVKASDGAANATATGGNGQPYSFSWSNNHMGPTPSALGAGIYTVTASDTKGCSATSTVAITEWDSIRVNVAFILPSCNGAKDGQAAVNQVSGGAGNGSFGNYSFFWSVPGTGDTLYVNGLAGNQNYTLTVSDQTGCSAVFTNFLDDPPPIVPVIQATDITCFGSVDGSATVVSVQSPQPITEYRWNTGALGQTLNNLPPAIYTVTARTAQGCTGSASAMVTEPPPLTLALGVQPLVCNNDSNGVVQALPQGGTPGYTFVWNTGAASGSLVGLGPGLYAVTVSDKNGCTAADSTALSQPNSPLISVETREPLCFEYRNGWAQLTVTGGTGPYRYSLDGQTFTGSGTFFGLAASTYAARVMDGLGCITTTTFVLNQPAPIIVQADPDVTITLGDSVLLTADAFNTAGAAKYFWRGAQVDELTCVNPPECSAVWASPQYTNTYTVLVTDSNGCTGSVSVRVVVEKPRGVYVPTGFSPNSDGNNDRLIVHGKGDQIRRVRVFRVFDRWGELVYEDFDFAANDALRGWDGTFRGQLCQSGVYIWYAEVEYLDGFSQTVQGDTALVR
ncbi:MAG: gliding motility-associated C-terminal domain-containing protein [Saprospiraceae bacterium]